MADETTFLIPVDTVLAAVRALLPTDFRASAHQQVDNPNLLVKIRTLDHESYIAITPGDRVKLLAELGEIVKPLVASVVDGLRRLAPGGEGAAPAMVVHPTPSPSPLPDPTPDPPTDP